MRLDCTPLRSQSNCVAIPVYHLCRQIRYRAVPNGLPYPDQPGANWLLLLTAQGE